MLIPNTTSAAATITISLIEPQIAATGAPTVAATTMSETAYNEDVELTASTTGITDANGIDEDSVTWQWQRRPGASGLYADITDATDATFTPLQVHVGEQIRACASFMDEHGTPAAEGPLCSVPTGTIVNVNDAPSGRSSNITVSVFADSSNPYIFSETNFLYTDEDSDNLRSITLFTLPDAGTLRVGDDAAVAEQVVPVAEISSITFYPDAGESATAAYTGFTFLVTDDGADPDADTNTTSTLPASLTITLTAPQIVATGAPTVSAASGTIYDQGVELTASLDGITDRNGIDADSATWQWQRLAEFGGFYEDITDATDATFTPGQEHVGQYIRACARFTDDANFPEGPLCSVPDSTIADVNDPPVATDNSIDVLVGGSYTFSADDFPFTDAEGDSLVYLQFSTAPANGTLATDTWTLSALPDGTAIFAFAGGGIGTARTFAEFIDDITYTPADGATAMTNYASFSYFVRAADRNSNTVTMTINLIAAAVDATGAPSVTDAGSADLTMVGPTEGSALTAAQGTIADTNGITTFSPTWRWQEADAPESGTPADRDYVDISGASGATFTPEDAQVGKFLRACAVFTDDDGYQEALCWAAVAPCD